MDNHREFKDRFERRDKLEGAIIKHIEGMTVSEVYALYQDVIRLVWKMNEDETDDFGDDMVDISASLEFAVASRLWERVRSATKAEEGRHASLDIDGDTVIALHREPHDRFTPCYSLGNSCRSPLVIIEGEDRRPRDASFLKATARWTAKPKDRARKKAAQSR